MECAGCGGTNREGARFCADCGAPVGVRCTACGAQLRDAAKFCDSCGTPVATSADASRKVVTVVFGDLSGSTSAAEAVDAEATRAQLDRYYAAMRAEVEAQGGRIVKFVGDGVMAAFGVPEVQENDAIRAVTAALGMQRAFAELALPMGLRVGVNTGEVVVSPNNDDVVGDAVNVAARLEGAADVGTVLVGEETWRLTRAGATYEAVEPIVAKGKTDPVPAYRLVDVSAASEPATPFVGREKELDTLVAAFDDVVAQRGVRLMTVVGAPGLGKTRLAHEFASQIGDRAAVIETRCLPSGAATLEPIAEAFRTGAGIDDTADPEAIRAAIGALVADDDPDRDRIIDRVTAVLGVGTPGSTEETFWAIRRMVEIGAATLPIVLVIDDLHWAEPLFLDLVEHLVEWTRGASFLLVGLARPDLRQLRPALTEGGRATSVIPLTGLDEEDARELARGLLGTAELPDALLARLPASTEGNPLFLRELVRMLVVDGVLRSEGDRWILTIDVDAIQVPPTIQSLLAARVERLQPDERTVLEVAAVVGKEFYKGALAELLPPRIAGALPAHLESLRRKELIEPGGTYWIDEPVYQFHHVLIRDAAYRRILKENRADLHARAAAWFEMKTADVVGEHDEVIGYHLEQAHDYLQQLGPLDDTGIELGRRAASLLGAASARAMNRDDLPAAAALAGRALDRLDDAVTDTRVRLLTIRAEALLGMGDVVRAGPAVAALEVAAAGSEQLEARAVCFRAHLLTLTEPARLHEVERDVAEAAEQLTAAGDQVGPAKAHNVRAMALARLGRVADSEIALDDALTAAREADDRRRINAVLGAAPLAALWGPSPVARAGGRCLDIVRLLRITTGSAAVEAISTRCQAVLEALRGRPEPARKMLRSARRTVEELGLRNGLNEVELFAGIVELIAGAATTAEGHLRAAYDGFRELGVDVDAGYAAAVLARTLLLLDRDDEASGYLDDAEKLSGDDLKASIAWRSARAVLHTRRGDFEAAESLATAAVELASGTDLLVDHGDACTVLAQVRSAAGDVAGARAASEQAAALYERKGATALIDRPVPTVDRQQGTASGVVPDNECARASRQHMVALATGDYELLARQFAADSVLEDRRRGFRAVVEGREARVEAVRASSVGMIRGFDMNVLATRGERLALMTNDIVLGDRRSEIRFLMLYEIDDAGAITRSISLDDVDEAFVELDQRYRAGEAASCREAFDAMLAVFRAWNSADWDSYSALIHEDVVSVDHRPAAYGRQEGVAEHLRLVRERSQPNADIAVLAVHRLAKATVLSTSRVTDQRGTEWLFHGVHHFADDGRLIAMDLYGEDQLADALARFDELTGITPADVRDNAASQRYREWIADQARRDWDAVEAALADDLVYVDRTGAAADVSRGPKALMTQLMSDVTVSGGRIHVIATRGDRLAVMRHVIELGTGEPFELDALTLWEVNDAGLLSHGDRFPPEDLDAAFEELDVRYLAGEGAPYADVMVSVRRASLAYQTQNWELLAEALAPDVVIVDRRLASAGEMHGLDVFVPFIKEVIEQSVSWRMRHLSIEAIQTGGMVGRFATCVTTKNGGEFEIPLIAVSLMREAVTVRFEQFAPEDLYVALARFDELTGVATPAEIPDNAALRSARRWHEASVRQDWNACRELLAPQSTTEDRTVSPPMVLTGTPDDRMTYIRAQGVETISAARVIPIATRGERLSLFKVDIELGHKAPFELEVLCLHELDESGREVFNLRLPIDDLDAAFDELDRRYAAAEGATNPEAVRALALAAAFGRDWDTYLGGVAPDYEIVDHRPASMGHVGRDDFGSFVSAVTAQASDVRLRVVAVHEVRPTAVLVQLRIDEVTEHGGVAETAMLSITVMRDGRSVRSEIYPVDALDAARARLGELADEASLAPLENACVAHVRQYFADLVAGAWDRTDQAWTADAVQFDRTVSPPVEARGRGQIMSLLRQSSPEVVSAVRVDPVATRGDRLALTRVHFSLGHRSPFELEFLLVTEIDAEGCAVFEARHAVDALDDAFDELDARYAAGEGSRYPQVVATLEWASAYGRDWETFFANAHADYVLVDHLPASIGEIAGSDRLADLVSAVASDARLRVVALHAIAPTALLAETRVTEVAHHGGVVENARVIVNELRDGRPIRTESYPVDALDAAFARFAELTGTSNLDNAAIRCVRAMTSRMLEGRWEKVAELHNQDFWLEDHRPGLRMAIRGVEENLRHLRAMLDIGVTRVEIEPVATRGDHLACARLTPAGDQYSLTLLEVVEDDGAGRIQRVAVFDADQQEQAFELLDEWSAEIEQTDVLANACTRVVDELAHGWRDGWDRVSPLISPNMVQEDRRRGLTARIVGLDGMRSGVSTFPTIAGEALAIRGDRLVLVHGRFERDGFGGETWTVIGIDDDGKIELNVIFDDPDVAFDELERLYVEGEGAPRGAEVEAFLRPLRAFNARDWAAFKDAYADDVVLHDNRPVSWGASHGPDEVMSGPAGVVEMISDARMRAPAIHRLADDLVAYTAGVSGTTVDGGHVQLLAHGIVELDGEGRQKYIELYDDLTTALRRFEELGAHVGQPLVVQVFERQFEAWKQRDWDAVVAPMHSEAVFVDHRVGLTAEVSALENLRVAFDAVTDPSWEVLATRGELLVVNRVHMEAGDFVVESLGLCEVDETGKVIRLDLFDPDALDDAFAELERRYIEGEGAPFARAWSAQVAFMAAFNARDFDALAATLSDDVVAGDRRIISTGTVDKAALVARLVSLCADVDDIHTTAPLIGAITPSAFLVDLELNGTDKSGGSVEFPMIAVHSVGADGLFLTTEAFDPEQRDLAMARFEELASQNAAVRNVHAYWGQLIAGNFDRLRDYWDEKARQIDRTAGSRPLEHVGADQIIENLMLSSPEVVSGVDVEVVATRGDNLCLHFLHLKLGHRAPYDLDMLQLQQVGPDGRKILEIRFPTNAVDEAIAELDRLAELSAKT